MFLLISSHFSLFLRQMNSTFHSNFDVMDELSQQKVPFFFMIDFLMENVEIFTENEIKKIGLNIDFQNFKTEFKEQALPSEIIFETFPPSENSYKNGFDIVQNHLKKGNSYLVNYTCKTEITTNLTLENFYQISQAKYKVLYPGNWMFFSPETFIEIVDNEVFTHPMKGTIDADVENAAEVLRNSVKEKAEHYTVVDLLRNDLSMIADEVKLKEFQRIDFLKTKQKNLLAMSSEISGKLKPEFHGKIGSIMKKVLPAGSVLGAPKPKTLEIIL